MIRDGDEASLSSRRVLTRVKQAEKGIQTVDVGVREAVKKGTGGEPGDGHG